MEGAISTIRWLEKVEAVLAISKFANEDMVLFSSHSFKDEALEWWNTIIQTRGPDRTYSLSWGEFGDMVERKFVSMNENEKIKHEFLNL
jgi:hypothetical protein